MASTPERGFLLIADLTGYTAYLSRGEIEHAPAIAGDLIETVVGRLEPPFRLAKLEGDAAFLYVEDGRADGSLLLDAIEVAYLAFRRRLRSIEQASACDCTACSTAPRLDLKFFVHHGEYVRTSIAGRDALFEVEVDVPADPATTWAHLTSPGLRPLWEGPIVITEMALDGRRGVGTRAQCVTGRLATLEEIVDWQPYEHVGYRLAGGGGGG